MRVLAIYFSGTGNNDRIAKEIQESLNCEILKIDDGQKRNFFRDSFYALTRKTVKINDTGIDLQNYEKIILLTPVWAGHIPAPFLTFLKKYSNILKDKNLYLASVSGFGEKNSKIIKEIIRVLGIPPIKSLFLTDKELEGNSYSNKLDNFIWNLK